MMQKVYISVGSNIDRRRNVIRAVTVLNREFPPIQQSSVYESDSVGFHGKPFYNMVIGFATDQSIEKLGARLKAIEHDCGRVRGPDPFVDRTLDLDIILFGDFISDDKSVDVPSRDILQYAFVLRPLAEIAPESLHPELGVSFASLWGSFDRASQPVQRVSIDIDLDD